MATLRDRGIMIPASGLVNWENGYVRFKTFRTSLAVIIRWRMISTVLPVTFAPSCAIRG